MSYTVSARIKNLRNVLDEVNKTENELFRIALFVTISAESLEELDSLTDYIKQKARSSLVALNVIAGGQEKGIHSVMPFAVNHFNGSKTSYTTNLLTEAASVLIPFQREYSTIQRGYVTALKRSIEILSLLIRTKE